METISISKFKATCLAVLERVRQTGQPVRITKFGKPIAEVAPAALENGERILGQMRDTLGTSVGADASWDSCWDPEETVREWDELNRPAPSRRRKSPKQK